MFLDKLNRSDFSFYAFGFRWENKPTRVGKPASRPSTTFLNTIQFASMSTRWAVGGTVEPLFNNDVDASNSQLSLSVNVTKLKKLNRTLLELLLGAASGFEGPL